MGLEMITNFISQLKLKEELYPITIEIAVTKYHIIRFQLTKLVY
jgi:hypothetical protein